MLVLSRRFSEGVVVIIDGAVVATIRVCDIRGDRVALGFAADPTVKFYRSELVDADGKLKPAPQPAATAPLHGEI